MRKVLYFERVFKHTTSVKEVIGQATFHQWGTDYQEFDSGPGNYSTAIIELPDGTVLNHPADMIKFTSPA